MAAMKLEYSVDRLGMHAEGQIVARRIIIDFDPGGGEQQLIHRVGNFGEDLYRRLLQDGCASISLDEIDRATTQLSVAVFSARRVRRISSLIERLLDRHGLAGVARLSSVNLPD